MCLWSLTLNIIAIYVLCDTYCKSLGRPTHILNLTKKHWVKALLVFRHSTLGVYRTPTLQSRISFSAYLVTENVRTHLHQEVFYLENIKRKFCLFPYPSHFTRVLTATGSLEVCVAVEIHLWKAMENKAQIQEAIKIQGEVVRKLKSEKASKEQVSTQI